MGVLWAKRVVRVRVTKFTFFNKSLLVIRVCFQKKGGLAGGPNGRDMGETSDGKLVISIGSVGEVSCVTDGGVVVCAGN